MILAPEALACLMISAEVKNGFAIVDMASMKEAPPRNEKTNSGEEPLTKFIVLEILGKSTLIDALANRIAKGSLKGTVTLNGEQLESKLLNIYYYFVMGFAFYTKISCFCEILMIKLCFRIDSLEIDMKDQKLTVIGVADPVCIVGKLRKRRHTEILTIEQVKEETKSPGGTKSLVEFNKSWQKLKRSRNSIAAGNETPTHGLSLKEAISASISRGKLDSVTGTSNDISPNSNSPPCTGISTIPQKEFRNG
ncbi:hypothetical protein L2E82_30059 [Cichorium intybus]|uniref:Uncharacterized protein n=1 Tax=Cichorium intybus TaxID=13427 RepID=A0ACB9CZN2_CICIN|nr:hypothetical protein L2E82_30059 [Cichorium intybus]